MFRRILLVPYYGGGEGGSGRVVSLLGDFKRSEVACHGKLNQEGPGPVCYGVLNVLLRKSGPMQLHSCRLEP